MNFLIFNQGIQVGLFNIMQERDIQIRGFNIRIPLDIMIIFTANPEDYTNRGNIITPLKDRIGSQILTHYPRTIEDGIKITEQEAWINRDSGKKVVIPHYFKEIIEQIAFQARTSEFVDQKSGVSARLTISCMENLVSNAERRAIKYDEEIVYPRICDLNFVLPGITGKIELVFEGEQEGSVKVSKALIGKAIREVFRKYFPDPLPKTRYHYEEKGKQQTQSSHQEYAQIIAWFEGGNKIEISDEMPIDDFYSELCKVKGLKEVVKKYLKIDEGDKYAMATAMEFVLDGLHQFSRIAKDEVDNVSSYKDMVVSIFSSRTREEF
jgi:magnesium chelatase subunit I